MTCARLIGHFRGLTWGDVRSLPLRDFNALVDQMRADIDAENSENKRLTRGRTGERRTPVMT